MKALLNLATAAALLTLGTTAASAAPTQTLTLPPQLFKPELLLPQVPVRNAPLAATHLQSAPVDRTSVESLTYTVDGVTRSVADFIADADAGVLHYLVLRDGKIVYEYNSGRHGPAYLYQSWSMMKQVLSALVGIAIAEGKIHSVDDPMDLYAPELSGNGFAGVTFKQALTMSSGILYDEEADRYQLFIDVIQNRLTAGLAGTTLHDATIAPSITVAYTPGSEYHYASINSQAIAMALEKAVGMDTRKYLQTKLWKPLGMPDSGKLLTDADGTDFTFCCLYATPHDYAVFGQLYAQGGVWNGKQIVPADWVRLSTTFADPATWHADKVDRKHDTDDYRVMGFGYHWWPLEGGRGDFTAAGIQGQSVYVSPQQNVVVVRLSADYTDGAHVEEGVAVARRIADFLVPPGAR